VLGFCAQSAKGAKPSLVVTTQRLLALEEAIFLKEDKLIQLHEDEKKLKEAAHNHQSQLAKAVLNLRAMATYSPLMIATSRLSLKECMHSFMLMQSIAPQLVRTHKTVLDYIKNLNTQNQTIQQIQAELATAGDEHTRLLNEQNTLIEQKYAGDALVKEETGAATPSHSLEEVLTHILKAFDPSAHKRQSSFTLMQPAVGNMDYTNNALSLKTRQSTQVVAPVDGRIIFAGHLKDLGHVVVIRQEDFCIILRGLGSLVCQLGEDMRKGEPLGRMPAPTHMEEAPSQIATLHMELRRGTYTLDIKPYVVPIDLGG
jgi:septal ring factor EnvC (AmiA/AmiB activator)